MVIVIPLADDQSARASPRSNRLRRFSCSRFSGMYATLFQIMSADSRDGISS